MLNERSRAQCNRRMVLEGPQQALSVQRGSPPPPLPSTNLSSFRGGNRGWMPMWNTGARRKCGGMLSALGRIMEYNSSQGSPAPRHTCTPELSTPEELNTPIKM